MKSQDGISVVIYLQIWKLGSEKLSDPAKVGLGSELDISSKACAFC